MPDVPLSAVARSLPDDPWAATVESWEGPVICTVGCRRLQPAGLEAERPGRQQPGAAGRHRRLRAAPAGRGAGHPAGHARDAGALGRRRAGRVAVETDRGTLTARSLHRYGLHRRAARRRDRVRPGTAAARAGLPARAADGPGDQGGVARHRAGSAGPAAVLLGGSAGGAGRRPAGAVPVLAAWPRLRAGLDRRRHRLGAAARGRRGGGGFRARRAARGCSAGGPTRCLPMRRAW